jgi:hypothetical protein
MLSQHWHSGWQSTLSRRPQLGRAPAAEPVARADAGVTHWHTRAAAAAGAARPPGARARLRTRDRKVQ